MDRIYFATCSLNNDLIRLMFIAEDHLEAAQRAFFERLPEVEERLNEGDKSVSVNFHEMPTALATALHLDLGETQDWWLGEAPRRKDQSEMGNP